MDSTVQAVLGIRVSRIVMNVKPTVTHLSLISSCFLSDVLRQFGTATVAWLPQYCAALHCVTKVKSSVLYSYVTKYSVCVDHSITPFSPSLPQSGLVFAGYPSSTEKYNL